MAQRCDLQALVGVDARHFVAAHSDKQIALVQNFVVLEVVQQGIGHIAGLGGQEHSSAFHARGRSDEDRFEKVIQPERIRAHRLVEQSAAIVPGQHEREHGSANQQGEPAPIQQLQHVGCPERQIHHKEEAGRTNAQCQRQLPGVTNHKEGEHGGDQHVSAHRNAVGGSQVAGRLEHDHRQNDGDKQAPVHKGHVNLSGIGLAGVKHLQTWQIAQLNHLLGDTEGSRDEGLRGDHRGHGGQAHQGQQSPVGGHQVKRVFNGFRVGQQQSALAEIVQGQARHDHAEPRQANRFFAEMAHVGIQRFATCDAQYHRTQNDERRAGFAPDEAQCMVRTDGQQNFGAVHDVRHPQNSDRAKPDQRDRAKELANACGAPFLHPKQHEQNDQGQRYHRLFKGWRDDLQTLYGGQHRDRRGDHTIAIKQAGAKDAHDQQDFAQLRPVFDRLRGQRQHGHQAALPVVVCAQHQHHVFDRHDGGEGPEKDGEDAVNVVVRERHMARAKHLFHGVQHAGADVAVNHANGTQSQGGERGFG